MIQAPSFLLLVINLFWSYWHGKPAGDDPWNAWTLEWSTTSPPPAYNFEDDAGRPQPPPALGFETSGRSGLEIRMRRRKRGLAPVGPHRRTANNAHAAQCLSPLACRQIVVATTH